MTGESVQAPLEASTGDPKHATRATRSAGRKMRSLLLDAASPLFRERGLSGTAITDIAAAADAFPSQITYYFRTKEALFVECACTLEPGVVAVTFGAMERILNHGDKSHEPTWLGCLKI